MRTLHRVGVAADHGGFELKEHLVGRLRAAGYYYLGDAARVQKAMQAVASQASVKR